MSATKFKFSLNAILSLTALVILLAELYFAYAGLYKNISAEPVAPQDDKIVRVDTASYKTTIEYLGQLKLFVPQNAIPKNTNPFK